MTQQERFDKAIALLLEVSANWSEEQVVAYTLPESFDEVVHKLSTCVTFRDELHTMQAITVELVKRGAPATFEYPGFINVGEWAFGMELGKLVGNSTDEMNPEGADGLSEKPCADSIEDFLRGISHMGNLGWGREMGNACLCGAPIEPGRTSCGQCVASPQPEKQTLASAVKTLLDFAKKQDDEMDAEPNPRVPTGDDWNDLYGAVEQLREASHA